MSKKQRPGVFDPWRQEEIAEEEKPKVEMPKRAPRPAPIEGPVEEFHPVQYQGTNGGVTVWLTGRARETSAQEARDALIDALRYLGQQVPGVYKALTAACLHLSPPENGSFVVISGSTPERQLRIAVPPGAVGVKVKMAFDRLGMGLRRLSAQFPEVKRYFELKRIKPYVK